MFLISSSKSPNKVPLYIKISFTWLNLYALVEKLNINTNKMGQLKEVN
jgi:hypothetical protein